MTQLKWKTLNIKRMDKWMWALSIFIIFIQVFLLFSPTRADKITTVISAPLIVMIMAYLLFRLGCPHTPVVLLPILFAFWFLACRIINGDWYLQESYTMVYLILFSCCVLFQLPFLVNKSKRDTFFSVFALLYCMIFSLIAWVAVIAALTGTNWVNPIDSRFIIGINEVYSNPTRLNILGIHPNISAVFFYTSLALLFFLFFKSRKHWIRLIYSLASVGLYLAICLSGSISSIIITGIIIGLVIFTLLFQMKRTRTGIIVATFAMLVVCTLVVITYPFVVRITSNIHDDLTSGKPLFNRLLITTAVAQDNQLPDEATVIQTNDFVNERLEINTMSLSMQGRFEMYGSAFLSIADRPITLIIGEGWQNAMDRSARMINYPYQNHVHNSYLQTLVVGGGLSFIMMLLFTLLLTINGAKLFFSKYAPIYQKILVLVPLCLLCHSMTEAILFVDNRIPNMLFFFIAGMIISYAKEVVVTIPVIPQPDKN